MHILCTICSDIVNQADNLYVTKCGHLFHHHCLSQWIERSRTCPQCRNPVTGACMWRVFPTAAAAAGGDDAATLQARLDDASLALRDHLARRREADAAALRAAERLAALQEQLTASEKRLARSQAAASALGEQLQAARAQARDAARLRADCDLLRGKLDLLHHLQKVVDASAEEVETMLEGYTDVRTIAVFATAFKRALGAAERGRRAAEGRLAASRADLALERARLATLHHDHCKLKELAATEPRPVFKRKSSDSDSSLPHKQGRIEPGADSSATSAELDTSPTTTTAAAAANDVSLGSLVAAVAAVAAVEAGSSPYWTLRSAPPALALQPKLEAKAQQASTSGAAGRENSAAAANKAAYNKLSIFHKPAAASDPLQYFADPELSFDGLGGRSRPDHFPTPSTAAAKRSLAPKRTAKHKLSRKPMAQDIGAMIQRINSKKQ